MPQAQISQKDSLYRSLFRISKKCTQVIVENVTENYLKKQMPLWPQRTNIHYDILHFLYKSAAFMYKMF